ncbi:MAG TPA: WhiB family transcriptional regulator [Acidimicrobiales bacterium]|nr:WhiB family transcriptional regulator [Acidimicrobiales bacterium]
MAEVVFLKPRWTQQDWLNAAACKGQTDTFFAPHGEQAEAREAREAVARAICMSCDVLPDCRDYAREHREQGFWGGENDDQRTEARRHGRRGAVALQA